MDHLQRQLRFHRSLLLWGGGAYLGWWFFVRLALPDAFNPLGSRLLVVACFFAAYGATWASNTVARNVHGWLAVCCAIATVHYFYLFDRNHADLNWVVGSYITVAAVCGFLQTARALLLYSLLVAGLSVGMLWRQTGVSYVVFLPGMLTTLVFANVGLRSRLRLVAQLRESNERIESLFDAGFDGIAVHDHGTIRRVNDALGSLVGRSRDELIGMPIPALFVPEARDRATEMVSGSREGAYEAEVLRKDGAHVTVEAIGKRHVWGGKEMQQVGFRDLTERKRAEAALVAANRDLEAFSYSVAHDLRAPLRAINGFAQLVLEDYGDRLDSGREPLERVVRSAQTMNRLIDALLNLARVGRRELRWEDVDLTALAATVTDELRAGAPNRAVELVAEPGIVVAGDPQLLRVVFDNLLGNAWKFTERSAAPRVVFGRRAEPDDGAPVYYVRDNGVGFDMARAKKLFNPFQRLHSGTEYPGTGIGLATVRRVVECHGGRVWAEAAPNEGATIFFTLRPG